MIQWKLASALIIGFFAIDTFAGLDSPESASSTQSESVISNDIPNSSGQGLKVQNLPPGDTIHVTGNASIIYIDQNRQAPTDFNRQTMPAQLPLQSQPSSTEMAKGSNEKWYWMAAGAGALISGLAVFYFIAQAESSAPGPKTVIVANH